MNGHAKRRGWAASDQLDWVGHTDTEGVGARQPGGNAPSGGGGYLDECTTPQVWADVKLRELAEMGMPRVLLQVAQAIGYDSFMVMWRVLDAAPELHSDSGSMIELQMRRYRSFQRYQRNKFIEALAPFLGDAEIQRRVEDELGEKLSLRHVHRRASRRRVGGT